MGMFLATSNESSEVNVLLGYALVHQIYPLPLPVMQLSSLPELIILGYISILGLGYWATGPTYPT